MTSPIAPAAPSAARSRPETFDLAGPTVALDPRINAFRKDLADITLAGSRFAPHYARAEIAECVTSSVMLLGAPREDATAVSQLLLGERFALLDRSGGWAWGRTVHDGYVGYLAEAALGPPSATTHRVAGPSALVFAHPDIKAPVLARLPFGARIAGTVSGPFVAVDGGYVHHRHLRRSDETVRDWAAVAEGLVGSPYLWGGRGGGGVDCSGLVQIALSCSGIAAPRDSDQQRDALGAALAPDAPKRRGDLIFFPGHVGIMLDGETMVHANAWWMAVTVEPLADVVSRVAESHPAPVVITKRLAS